MSKETGNAQCLICRNHMKSNTERKKKKKIQPWMNHSEDTEQVLTQRAISTGMNQD